MGLLGDLPDSEAERWASDFSRLAQFNSERARGLVHTPEWVERMREIQEEFNRRIRPEATQQARCRAPYCLDAMPGMLCATCPDRQADPS